LPTFFSPLKKRISALLNIFEGLGWREVIKVRPRFQIQTGEIEQTDLS
jgi:hypothetical protein